MKHQIIVTNITCGGCVSSIKNGLRNIEGVKQVEVNQNAQLVTVEGEVEKSELTAKLAALGYPEK